MVRSAPHSPENLFRTDSLPLPLPVPQLMHVLSLSKKRTIKSTHFKISLVTGTVQTGKWLKCTESVNSIDTDV